MRYKVLWKWMNISLVEILECSQSPHAWSLNQRRELSETSTSCVLSACDPFNLSTFITSQEMRNYTEQQVECDDILFVDAHIPEIETDIFFCTKLNREHHCSPLVYPEFKWTMTYELFYYEDITSYIYICIYICIYIHTYIYLAQGIDKAMVSLMLCSILYRGLKGSYKCSKVRSLSIMFKVYH